MHKLVEVGMELFNDKKTIQRHKFADNAEADKYLSNIKEYPHLYVLGCLMDRGIKAERAWIIPYLVCKRFNKYSMKELVTINKEEIVNWFIENKPHRYNEDMGKIFYEAIHMIHDKYNDDASLIWKGKPSSATVVYRFLEFNGAGIKIATMAANILVREFGIELADYYSIDISPDVHVKRVFYRLGLIDNRNDINLIIYKARELYPEFPGIMDVSCWEIGRTYCDEQKPKCDMCPLGKYCKRIIADIGKKTDENN